MHGDADCFWARSGHDQLGKRKRERGWKESEKKLKSLTGKSLPPKRIVALRLEENSNPQKGRGRREVLLRTNKEM